MTLAPLSSPSFTGADLSTRMNAALTEVRAARRFPTVGALLADTTMAYGAGSRLVAAGDRIVTAEGHAYEVAAAGASDHHVTTAGGVRLYVRAGANGAISAAQWGYDGTLTQAMADAITAWANAARGRVVFPPGGMAVDGTVSFDRLVQADVSQGEITLDFSGVVVTSGWMAFDSCKRLHVLGLNAAATGVRFRGVWSSTFTNCRFGEVWIENSALTSSNFSSAGWNRIIGGAIGAIVVDASYSSWFNQNTLVGVEFRGDASQGFTASRAYAIDKRADVSLQNLTLIGCDLSYYNTAIYNIAAAVPTNVTELFFEQCYFDSRAPQATTKALTRIEVRQSRVAGKFAGVGSAPFAATLRGSRDLHSTGYSFGTGGVSGINLLPNGDFMLRPADVTVDGLISNGGGPFNSFGTGATASLIAGGLYGSDRGHSVRVAYTTSTTTRFRVPNAPITGPYTAVVVLAAAPGTGTQSPQIGMGGQFYTESIGETPTVLTLTVDEVAGGSTVDFTINGDASLDIIYYYAGIFYGRSAPLLAFSPRFEIKKKLDLTGLSIAAGTKTASATVSVPGAVVGDQVAVGCTGGGGSLFAHGKVSAADTVAYYIENVGGSLFSGNATLYIRVLPRGY